MEFVNSQEDVQGNLAYLDAARDGRAEGDRRLYKELIQRGTCFLAYTSGSELAFAPSRFIGYKNNSFTQHAGNARRDGRLTNPLLSEIFGAESRIDEALEHAYRAYCRSLGIVPRPSGTAGAPRRYWLSSGVERYLENAVAPATPLSTTKFDVHSLYTRDQVADILKLPEMKRIGNWLTGYSRQGSEFIVFANVGTAGRTGHDYANRWQGKQLAWMARGNAAPGQPELTDMLSGNFPVHVFWRGKDRGSFTYAGSAVAAEASDTRPVQVIWNFPDSETTKGGVPLAMRRGPPPTSGSGTIARVDGATQVYLMKLVGPVSAAFPNLEHGQHVIKIGMSNNPERRREDLSCGFPPGCILGWTLIATRSFPSGHEAFAAEGALLELLRVTGNWIGGEFAIVNNQQLEALAQLQAGGM